jgi:hypothetical protein
MGAICQDCGKDMQKAHTCTHLLIQINAGIQMRNTDYYDVHERCHDCGILNSPGNIHHYGCDIERCPLCSGQLISCGCKKGGVSVYQPKANIAFEMIQEEICERGNTWLQDNDNHVFWAHLDGDRWLESTVTPGNYPGFFVRVIETTEEKLAAHINKNCQGWSINHLNIKGVKTSGGTNPDMVIGNEDD